MTRIAAFLLLIFAMAAHADGISNSSTQGQGSPIGDFGLDGGILNLSQGGGVTPPITGHLLLEDGVSSLLLEDGSSDLCFEGGC